MQILEFLNGGSEPFSFGTIFSGLVGISMLARGIKGFFLHKEDRPLPTSFTCFIWLLIGVPILIMLWTILLAIINISEFWPFLLSIFPIVVGIMAINSVYEEKSDTFSLLRCYVMIYTIGIAMNLLNLILEPTIKDGIMLIIQLCIAAGSMLYLYRSKGVAEALPIENRTESKIGKWATISYAVILGLFTILLLAITFISA